MKKFETIVLSNTEPSKSSLWLHDSKLQYYNAGWQPISDNDTVFDPTSINSRLDTLESIDHSQYLTQHQDISHLATKEELQEATSKIIIPIDCSTAVDNQVVIEIEGIEQYNVLFYVPEFYIKLINTEDNKYDAIYRMDKSCISPLIYRSCTDSTSSSGTAISISINKDENETKTIINVNLRL